MNCFSSVFLILTVIVYCDCQRRASLPITPLSLRQIFRSKINVPEGRKAALSDIIFRYYGNDSSHPISYRLRSTSRLLHDSGFDMKMPTVVYAHGYVEYATDESVQTVVQAYQRAGGCNLLVLDWANLGFGNYLAASADVKWVGIEAAKALTILIDSGLSLSGLHLVGHSLGAHVLAAAARHLGSRGYTVPRLTGLDPAYPGFYPAFLGTPIQPSDAAFVDIIHTDGGEYGTPEATGHADFWPNAGQAKQPGCPPFTLPLSTEDFCSHWRSWAYWAESVTGGEFLSRRCEDYDSFLRGSCEEAPVMMGLKADSKLRGNFYLRTATKPPYALGMRGAD